MIRRLLRRRRVVEIDWSRGIAIVPHGVHVEEVDISETGEWDWPTSTPAPALHIAESGASGPPRASGECRCRKGGIHPDCPRHGRGGHA